MLDRRRDVLIAFNLLHVLDDNYIPTNVAFIRLRNKWSSFDIPPSTYRKRIIAALSEWGLIDAKRGRGIRKSGRRVSMKNVMEALGALPSYTTDNPSGKALDRAMNLLYNSVVGEV